MTRYALVIGIQKYGGSGFGDLKKSAGDAEAIAAILEAHGDFVEVIRLPRRWNEAKNRYEMAEDPVTRIELEKAIVDFFKKVGGNEALIYFSGHGDQVSRMGRKKGYLVTSGCTTATVATDGIALEDLNGLIVDANFSNLVVLLDCCHSGSLLEKSQITTALGAFGSGYRNYFLATACRGDEKAYEGAEYSLFTAAVLKALQSPGADGRVRTSKLNQMIDDELRGSGQKPVVLKSGDEITLVTHAGAGTVVMEQPDRSQLALERLRPDYEILDAAFFEAVAEKVAKNQARTQILKLRSANWSMLFQGNYVARDQQGEALEMALGISQQMGISLMLIRGEPGAGKTALLRWLAYELFGQGKRVFHQKSQERFGWLEQLRAFSEAVDGEHFYVIADDLFRDESILEALQENEFLFPMTLIGTTRQNEDRHGTLEGTEYETVCLDLAKPSDAEKERVLALPEVQEHLIGKSAAERQKLMDSPIMLVLMLQLSAGKPFDVLLWDIVKDLPNTDRQPLYQAFGVLCCFFQYGVIVPFEILKLCLPLSNYSERMILGGLEGLIDISISGGYEGLMPIHELIAKTVMNLDFRPDENQNQPYAWIDRPSLLEQNLRSIVPNLDVTQETQKRWIYRALRLLAVIGETELVSKIRHDYSAYIQPIQQTSNIMTWSMWATMYFALGHDEERQRCLHAILLTQPQVPEEWKILLLLVQRIGDREQQYTVIAHTRVWLDTYPDYHDVFVHYLGLIAQCGSQEQQQEAIVQTKTWLESHNDDSHVRVKYIGLVETLGSREHQQEAIGQTKTWLESHNDDSHVRVKYTRLVETLGSRDQQQEAIIQTKTWLDTHLDDFRVRIKYIGLVENLGSREQQQEAIVQTETWLNTHPNDSDVRTKYIGLVENLGSREQQQEAIVQTKTWLESHNDDSHVRVKYIGLVENLGSREQQQETIVRTKIWLDIHPDDDNVRIKYLGLVENLGSREQQQEAIVQTKIWLDTHSGSEDIRSKYLTLVYKTTHDKELVSNLIYAQWLWVTQQIRVGQIMWNALLPALYHHASSDVHQAATKLVLTQHPENLSIICQVFGYFRDHLDYKTCHELATHLSQSKLSIDKWQNYIHAANFFRDHNEFAAAEEIYRRTIGVSQKRSHKFPEVKKTIDFANLSYAQLLLLIPEPQPDQVLERIDNILKRNPRHSFAHLLKAQAYQDKGSSFYMKAISHFDQAIKFDQQKNGSFYFKYAYFYRYAVGDLTNARDCFEKSLTQKPSLPANIELAEIVVEVGDVELAKSYLQDGLSIMLITRPEKEEREKLNDRIIALKILLNVPD
jgi:tetratricopeptide (TPR) repeat protein